MQSKVPDFFGVKEQNAHSSSSGLNSGVTGAGVGERVKGSVLDRLRWKGPLDVLEKSMEIQRTSFWRYKSGIHQHIECVEGHWDGWDNL